MSKVAKYISNISLARMYKKLPVSYHASTNCGFLVKPGGEYCEVSNEDMQVYSKYLNPCQRCHPKPPAVIEKWPKKEIVELWVCSDHMEFNSELDALRHEIDIFRRG
jgi:hypothetical protein